MKKLVLTFLTLSCALSLGISPAQAKLLPPAEGVQHFTTQASHAQSSLHQAQAELALVDQNLYWGRYSDNGDGTWWPLMGFIFPGITQVVIGSDSRAPGWLRTVSWLQLLALASTGAGFTMAASPTISNSLDQSQRNIVTGMTFGGIATYIALGLIPSTVVSMHDGGAKTEADNRKAKLEAQIKTLAREAEHFEQWRSFYLAYENQDYEKAGELLQYIQVAHPGQFMPENGDFIRLKELAFKTKYQQLQTHFANNELETALNLTNQLLNSDIIAQFPLEQSDIESKKALLTKSKQEKDDLNKRENIIQQAYQAASQQDYVKAVEILASYPWSQQHAQYEMVVKKQQEWRFILYSQLYKQAYNLAANGQVEEAVKLLREYSDNWPTNHPDFARVKQKQSEWLNLLLQKEKSKQNQGYLSESQIKSFKSLSINPIIPTYFPAVDWEPTVFVSGREYNSEYSDYSYDHTYKIVYFNKENNISYAMIGSIKDERSSVCSPYFGPLIGSYLYQNTLEKVSSPLGKIGIVSLPFADAYMTQQIGKRFCYVLVTPASIEPSIIAGVDEIPAKTGRLSKEEFKKVVGSIKYLP